MIFSVTTHPARNDDLIAYAESAIEQGFNDIHLDFMDGVYTPEPASNVTEAKVLALAFPDAEFCVHIMSASPEKHCKQFYNAMRHLTRKGKNEIVFQIEGAKKPLKILKKHARGIAIDLDTDVKIIDKRVLERCGSVLVMLVKAGASGQKQESAALEKIKWLKENYPHINVIADGGINKDTLKASMESGADVLSLGSFGYQLIKEEKGKQFLDKNHK